MKDLKECVEESIVSEVVLSLSTAAAAAIVLCMCIGVGRLISKISDAIEDRREARRIKKLNRLNQYKHSTRADFDEYAELAGKIRTSDLRVNQLKMSRIARELRDDPKIEDMLRDPYRYAIEEWRDELSKRMTSSDIQLMNRMR